jgi:hypothetical protein
MIEQYVLGLQEVDEMQVAIVGGKGGHLGGLSRIDGIRVPANMPNVLAAGVERLRRPRHSRRRTERPGRQQDHAVS